jgi:putative membrane protein
MSSHAATSIQDLAMDDIKSNEKEECCTTQSFEAADRVGFEDKAELKELVKSIVHKRAPSPTANTSSTCATVQAESVVQQELSALEEEVFEVLNNRQGQRRAMDQEVCGIEQTSNASPQTYVPLSQPLSEAESHTNSSGTCRQNVAPRKVHPLPLLASASSKFLTSRDRAVRRTAVLNTGAVAGQDTGREYNIIGKCEEHDPWQHEPELKPQVAYNPKDWLSIPVKLWVSNINWTVFFVVVAVQSVLTWAVFHTSNKEENGEACHGFCDSALRLDNKAHSYTGLALFLLIAFRANSSYDRFWDGRKQWGFTINRTRDLARQMVLYITDTEPKKIRRILAFIVAFAVTKKRHLRDEKGLQELQGILSVQDLRNIQEAQHMPYFCLHVIGNFLRECYQEGKISDHILQLMDKNLTNLIDNLGGCERIKKTPIPVAFVVHMRAFMVLWLVTLPLTLAEDMGWTSILICVIVAYAILGIDAMSVEIENPFGHDYNDLPLGTICETIAQNVLEILDRSQHPDCQLVFDGVHQGIW